MPAKPNPLPAPTIDEMPRDGTPVTYSATYARQVGDSPVSPIDGGEEAALAEDYEENDWEVHRQTQEGWRFIDRYEGRPYDPDLRDSYGPGRYRVQPIGRDGKPVKRLSEVRTIGTPNRDPLESVAAKDAAPSPLGGAPGEGLSPWLQFQAQQMAEERRETRRRAEEAEERREERQRGEKEWERRRRESADEERRERLEREDRQAAVRQEQQAQMIAQIAGVVQAGMSTFANRAAPTDLNEGLLRAMMADRGKGGSDSNSIRETMELLLVLDQLAESRKPEADEKPEPSMTETMAAMVPMMMAMKGGGAGAMPPGLPGAPVSGVPSNLLTDPVAINAIASEDPQGVAEALVMAVRSNPRFEDAVVEAFKDSEPTDEE